MRAQWLLVALAPGALIACESPPLLDPSTARWEDVRLQATQYEMVNLGAFGPAQTQGLAIDKHGNTFGRYGSGGSQRSFRWTARDGFRDLGDFEGRPFLILNANDHGMLNGTVRDGATARAVAWLPRQGFIHLDGTFSGTSLGSSDRGEIAGTRIHPDGRREAFVWHRGTVTILPIAAPGTPIRSGASDVNEKGEVAGVLAYSGPAITIRAFVWHETSGTRLLPPPAAGRVGVTSISDEGVVTGAAEDHAPQAGETVGGDPVSQNPGSVPVHAWKWSADQGMVLLGTLGGDHAVAWHSDRFGNVYGWARDGAGVSHAVKWPATGGIVDLGTLGGHSGLGGLNKHGELTGWSTTADGAVVAVQYIPRMR